MEYIYIYLHIIHTYIYIWDYMGKHIVYIYISQFESLAPWCSLAHPHVVLCTHRISWDSPWDYDLWGSWKPMVNLMV